MASGVAYAVSLILVVGHLQDLPGTHAKTFTFPEYPYKETTKNTIRAGLRGKRRLQVIAASKKRRRKNQMHSRMRVTVLLQGNLLIRSVGGRRDRRKIKFLQGLFYATQRKTTKVKGEKETTITSRDNTNDVLIDYTRKKGEEERTSSKLLSKSMILYATRIVAFRSDYLHRQFRV